MGIQQQGCGACSKGRSSCIIAFVTHIVFPVKAADIKAAFTLLTIDRGGWYIMKKIIAVFFAFLLLIFITKGHLMAENNDVKATIKTTEGDIVLKLYPDIAPKTVENFVKHAEDGYYDGVIFHRVIKGFMIQGGDPTGTGLGGESIWGHPFEDEFKKGVEFDKPGLIAMANAGPNTNGSQFFITTVLTPWLNYRHTIFGEVIDGMDVVKQIESVETDSNDRPVKDVKILSVEVTR